MSEGEWDVDPRVRIADVTGPSGPIVCRQHVALVTAAPCGTGFTGSLDGGGRPVAHLGARVAVGVRRVGGDRAEAGARRPTGWAECVDLVRNGGELRVVRRSGPARPRE